MSLHRYDGTTVAVRCDGGCGAEIRGDAEITDGRWRRQMRVEAAAAGWVTRRGRNGRHRDFCEDCR